MADVVDIEALERRAAEVAGLLAAVSTDPRIAVACAMTALGQLAASFGPAGDAALSHAVRTAALQSGLVGGITVTVPRNAGPEEIVAAVARVHLQVFASSSAGIDAATALNGLVSAYCTAATQSGEVRVAAAGLRATADALEKAGRLVPVDRRATHRGGRA